MAALTAARGAGAFSVAGNSEWRRRRLTVLCYHGVSIRDEHEWSALYVSQGHLRNRLQRLRDLKCTLLPLDEALERQRANDLPPRAVALTFDDGASDFRTRAYPVLQEFDAPAMLYQTTWYMDKPFPVFNTTASYLLWKARGRDVRLPWRTGVERIPDTTACAAFQRLHRGLLAWVHEQQLDADAQHALLLEIAQIGGVALDPVLEHRLLHVMSSQQLGELDPSVVDIQLHSHRHRITRDRDVFIRELEDNANALRQVLPRKLTLRHFCYPSGEHDAQRRQWLRAWGMLTATTCDPGLVDVGSDRLLLPRFIDSQLVPAAGFDAWATGAVAFLPGRRRS